MNISSHSFKFRDAKCLELLTEPLCKIINLALSSKFALMCKTAKVKHFHKNGKNSDPKN